MSCLLRPHLTTRRILILPSFFVWFTDALANAKEENVNIHATLDKTLEDLNSFWVATGPSTTTSYCSTPSPLALFLSVLADCLAGGVGGLLIVFGEGNTFFSPHLAKRFSPVDQMADRLSHIPPQYLRMLSWWASPFFSLFFFCSLFIAFFLVLKGQHLLKHPHLKCFTGF